MMIIAVHSNLAKTLSCLSFLLSEWLSVIIMNCLSVDLLSVRIFLKFNIGGYILGISEFYQKKQK